MQNIYMTYGDKPHKMALALLNAAGIAKRVPMGASIGLKPNMVVSRPASEGATTHPEIAAAIIEYLLDYGHKDVFMMESCGVGDRTGDAFQRCGYMEVSRRYNIPIYDLKKDKAETVHSPIGELMVCGRALRTEYIINLPVLKGHCQTTLTCALKNLKGCIPDSEKRRYHTMGLHKPIAALASVLKPALTIVDSICGDLNFEEGGTPVQTNRMYLGEDPVQLDAYGCSLMGIDTSVVNYIALAEQYGAGYAAFAEESIITLGDPKEGNAFPKPSGKVKSLTAGVNESDACSVCFGNLVHALYRSGGTRGREIYIGQGYKGKELSGVGIGNCCIGAPLCAKGCPPSAAEIQRALEQ